MYTGATVMILLQLSIYDESDRGADDETLTNRARHLPQAPSELVDNRCVIGSGLVVHAPSAADELKPTGCHEVFYDALRVLGLVHPPFPEECRLYVDEPEGRHVRDVD